MAKISQRDLSALTLWIVIMVAYHFVHGFENVGVFLIIAWIVLIISGLLIVISESIYKKIHYKEEVMDTGDDTFYENLDKLEAGRKSYISQDYAGALDYFIQLPRAEFQDDVEYLTMLADCYHQIGNHEKSIKIFDEAILLKPYDCHIYFQRSWPKRRLGDYTGAVSDIENAIKFSKIKNLDNEKYVMIAQEMEWCDHTTLYESNLYMLKKKIELEKIRKDMTT